MMFEHVLGALLSLLTLQSCFSTTRANNFTDLNDTFVDVDTTESPSVSDAQTGVCPVFDLQQCDVVEYWNENVDVHPSCDGWNTTSYGAITNNQNEFLEANKWRTVMWFDDNIWSGTLADYQTILQESFTFAIIDLHHKYGATNLSKYAIDSLSLDEVYVNVTFFLGFCLLATTDDCQVIKEDELEGLEESGEIAGNREDIPYYVYSLMWSTEEKTEYVHSLIKTFSYDYMAFASMRMMCTDFTTILDDNAATPEEIEEIEFKGWALYVTPLKFETPWEVPEILNIAVGSFVAVCFCFAAAGAVHGFVFWKADCIRVSGIIYFGLYTWDFYSDIVFTLSLWDSARLGNSDIVLFYAAATFVVVPWIANMVALSRYQNKWCKDETIRERVYQWFVSWQRLTYALAALSGSAFGTVELANSYVFGLDFFCMGLNERHLKKFNNNRLYSSILVENAPQICIQIIYLTQVVEEFKDLENEEIALAALAASTLSVGAALLDIYASKKLFSVLKKDGQYVGKTSCSIFVISPEIKQNATRLQISTYAFRDAIAETLSTHPRSVEMHFPIATSTGFKMKFTIFSSKLTPDVIYAAIKKGAEQKLPKRIQQQWRLMKVVVIPLDRIEVERVENENDGEEGLSAPLSKMNGLDATSAMITGAAGTADTRDPTDVQNAIEFGSNDNDNNNNENVEEEAPALPKEEDPDDDDKRKGEDV